MPYAGLAQELLEIMDPEKRRPPNEEMDRLMRGEMAVLRLLHKERRLLAGELSRRLNMTTSRIAAVLSSLEKKRLITRSQDKTDRRRVSVMITPAGVEFCAARRGEVHAHMQRLLERMGERDAEEYVRLMRRATQIISSMEEERAAQADAPEGGQA